MWNYVLKYSSLGKTNNIQVIIELYLSVKRERSVFSFFCSILKRERRMISLIEVFSWVIILVYDYIQGGK